ncbi:TcdA/TcdB catalytic glycosyltransferase domain-containing protein [Amycolatopsis circi]|uniref:TcdA/TcdB catalytic glycosyltransferase domain-containing protein n=1 Tax=Amycolatopsis circi TaxID=871959 RepID=UPI001ABFBE78|nr:TcdA/TcdB catalytic glycosyltransferase domain-containing protein [Amycolatopsis circi]
MHETGIIGDLGTRNENNRDGIGVVATVAATPNDNLQTIAEKYSTGFTGNSSDGRFALVIGINGTPGSEQAINHKIQQFQNTWDNRFPVAVIGFTWKHPSNPNIDQKTIPYGGIRETIARNPVTEKLIGQIREAGGDNEVYLHTGDADVHSLNTRNGPLFDAVNTAVRQNPEGPPELISGGYHVRPEDGDLANRAAQLDLDVRQALAGVDPRAVYFPEPNTFVRMPGNKLENDATFGTKNPNTGNFDYGAKEGQGLADSVLSQRNPSWQYSDHPTAIANFSSDLAIQTDGTRIAGKVGTDPNGITALNQSHANETIWSDLIGHYLGNHTTLDPNLAKIAAKAAFHDITPSGPTPPRPEVFSEVAANLPKNERTSLGKGMKENVEDGKKLAALTLATRQALVDNLSGNRPANPQTPAAAPKNNGQAKEAPKPAPKTLPGPKDWNGRRDTAPVTRFSSERFDPIKKIAEQFTGNRAGLKGGQLAGAMAHIRFDVRRFEIAPGQWVREHTIPIDLTSHSGSVSPEQREQFIQDLRAHLDEWVNQNARLPGGDQVHVRLDVRVADDIHPGDTSWQSDPRRRIPVNLHDSAVDPDTPETNQLNWDVHDSAFGVTHELMHFLGLGDGYKNNEMLFNRGDQPGVMGPDAWHDSRFNPGNLDQLEQVSNTANIRDHHLGDAPAPNPPPHQESHHSQPEPDGKPNLHTPIKAPQDPNSEQNQTPQHYAVLVADEQTEEQPDNRPFSERLPEFVRDGKALGSVVPVDVRGAKDVGTGIENLIRRLNPKQQNPPQPRGIDAITDSLSGPEFESFMGDGRKSMVRVGEKWYEVHVTAEPDFNAVNADQITKLPQPTIGDVKNEVKTTHASPNTDTTAKVVGSSYFGMFPAGPYASVGGTAQLASPSAEHTGTTTGTEQRVIRTAGDMQKADAPVTYRITVRNETGGLVGSTVDGHVGLVLSTDLANLKQEQTVGPAEPKPDWAKKIEFLSPEAVDFDENALFDQVSKNLHPSVTKFGAPGRTSLREFLSRGGVRSMLGTAMQGSPVVSNDLLSPHGAHRDAVQLAVRPTNVEYLGTIPGDSELRFNDSAVNGGSTTVSSKYGGEVNAIFGGGSYVPGTAGGVAGVSGSYSRKVNQQSTSGTSFTNKSTVNAKGDIGLYKVTADLEVTTSTGEKTTVQATSYTRMGLPEAKAQGLPVPKNTPTKFKDVGARYEPPYLAAAVAAGTARPGSFEPATRVQPQIENALRNLPGADKFLPRWDQFQSDKQGSSRDIAERFANLRKITSKFSAASLRGKMDSLFTQGVSAQLKRRGLFTDEYLNVTVKAKPGPGRHLGQADGRSVKNSNETSPSLTSATTTERGWSAGLEGRVIVPGGTTVANLGISPTVSPLQYSDNRTWKNSGGPTVTTTTGKGGSPDSQVFEHDVEFEVEITSYTRNRPWVRRLTPGSPFRITPKVSTVAKTGDPDLPPISGKVDLWINDGAALTKDPSEFAPGKPGVVSMTPNETPSIDDLLTQQQNQTTPKFLHVEAFANTEALRDEALRQLQRAAGGDAVLGLSGSEARARVDRIFSPENFRGLTPKLLKQGVTANGFRYERRVADRVGGLGMGISLSNPKLVAVSETGGGDRTYSGGSKASYEGSHKQSIEANVQLGLTVRPTGTDTHGQGQLFGTAKWSPWQRSSGSSHEVTASIDHTNRSSSDSRTVLVQYDTNVRLIAESRQEGLINGSISRAGADVHLPGSVFVAMTEDEARAEGLLPPVAPRNPAPGKLSAPPMVGGKSSSLGSAVLEDAPNLAKLVQDARQQLGKLGDKLLPKSVLDDSVNNLQRTLDTASPEAVTSLVDGALDGGVSLLAQDPGVLWTDNYQLLLKAKILDTQFLDVKHDGTEVDHVANATRTDKENSGHGSSYGGQIRGAGRGLFQDSQPKVSGYDGAYLGASGTRAKSDQTVENKTTTTALTSSSSGPSARYQHQFQFELVVARDGHTYPVASQEATVTSRSSADDHKISGDEQYHTKLYGSRTTELNAAESTPDRLAAWQQEGFGPLPKSSTVEGLRGAADVRAAAIRALRLAGAGNGLTGPGTGAHNTLSSSITNETLQAHLPDMVGKPFAIPDLHSSALTGSSHASVQVYTRVVKPDLVGLSDSVKLERSDQSGSTFTGEAKETVTGEQQGNIGTGGITDPGRNTHAWGGVDVRGPVGQNDPSSSTAAAQRSVVGKDKGRTGLVGLDVEYRVVATIDGKTAAVEVRVPQSSRTRMSETDLEQSLGQPLPETLSSAQDNVKKAAEDWRTAEEELEKAQRDFDDAWLSENDNVRTATDGARGLNLPVDNNPVQQMRQAVQTAQNEARDVGQALRAGNDEITRLNELDEQLLSLALGEEPGSVAQSDLVARAWDTQRQVQQIRNEQAELVQQRQTAQDRAAEILAVLDEYRNNHTDHSARQDDANNRIQEAREKADEALRKWWQAKSDVDNQLAAHAWPRPPETTPEQHREGTVEANDTVSGLDTDTDRPYSFDPAEIQVRKITDSSGRVRAVSFLPANEHTESVEREWVAHNSGKVSTLPEGATPDKFDPLLKQANETGATPELSGRRFGEWADQTAAPWDDDSLFVFAHGREQSVKVTLLGGRTVRVDGDTFARIVAQAAPLAQSPSVTLIACSTGQTDGPGGLAHDFQRALSELGGPSTVHAPTKPALFGRDSATLGKAIGATHGFTAVTDGGHFRTFGDSPVPSTTDTAPRAEEHHYSSPEDLVSDLRQTAVNNPPPAPLLGPDLFGLYRAPEPPEFLRGHDFRNLTAGQGISFLDLLDLTKGYQRSSEHFDPANLDDNRDWTLEKERPDDQLAKWAPGDVEPLAKTTSTPLLMHAIWLGGPLKDTGTMHTFRRNFGDAADRLGDGIVPILWTDVPRWQTELALTTAAPEEGPDPLHDVRDMLRWATEHRIQLANVDEVFTSEHPMRTQEFYLSELAKQTGPGYAAASDILRLELMHRFGGLYTDGDNVVHGLDDVVRAVESDTGYAVHRVGGNIANSAFTMSKGHPFAASYLDQLRDNYGQTQANLMPREVDSLGQGFFATPMGRVHRQSVMYRSGPVAMTETARRIGLNSALELPGMTEIRMNSDHSWLLPPQGDPAPLSDRFETLELTQRVIQTLVRGLHNRDGDLHLTAVEPAVRRHANPDLVWHAALSYIAADPDLSALVRTVTDRSSYTGEIHDVPLPPAARALLAIDDSRVHYHLGEVQRAATMQAADAVLVADTPLENLISRLRSTDGPVPPIEVTGTGPDGRANATAAARDLAGHLADALGADVLDRVPVKIRVSEGDGRVRISFRTGVEMSVPTPRVFRGLDDGPAPGTPQPWTHNGRTVGMHYSPSNVSVPNGVSFLTTDATATRAFTEQLRTDGTDRPADAVTVRLSAAEHPTADYLLSGTADADLLLEELVRTATHRWWFRPTPPAGPIALSDRDGTAKLLGWVLAELGRGESAASIAEDVARHERPDLIWTAARELAALHDDLTEQHAVLHLHGVTDTLLGKPDAAAVLSDLAKATRDGADVTRIAEAVEVLDRHGAPDAVLNAPGGRALLLEEIARLADHPNPDGYARDLAAVIQKLATEDLSADAFRTALRNALDGPRTRPTLHRLSVVGLGWLDRWHTAAAIRRYQAEERAAAARQAAELAGLADGSPRHG